MGEGVLSQLDERTEVAATIGFLRQASVDISSPEEHIYRNALRLLADVLEHLSGEQFKVWRCFSPDSATKLITEAIQSIEQGSLPHREHAVKLLQDPRCFSVSRL